MLTLWDLLKPIAGKLVPRRAEPVTPVVRERAKAKTRPRVIGSKPGVRTGAMQARYDAMVAELLEAHGIKIRKWRKNMSGIARQTTFTDGRVLRTLESPRPTGPMSAAIFLHEVGHHVIGFNVYKPRCLEEYHAWAYAIRELKARGFTVTEGVQTRMNKSLKYAVAKARRRGLREVPEELRPYWDE
ncbi:MAG: hypothetical protein AABZ53_12485 [Planctomycetota bacterium]